MYIVRLPFDIDTRRGDKKYSFRSGQLVDLDKWPGIAKAMRYLGNLSQYGPRRLRSVEDKMVRTVQSK